MLESYRRNVNFIKKYASAVNASSGSEVDSNANVENKNITTCMGEIPKREIIGTNRLLMCDKLTELYGEDFANEYIRQLESHEIYKHDETSIMPYCVSITMYPFLFGGLKDIGGISSAPTNLQAFQGSFINLVFAIASQFAGAVATPEYLMYLDYFIRKEYGEDYYKRVDDIVVQSIKPKTIDKVITDGFEQVVYSMNQPAAARNFQSVFWNVAYFDKPYFEGMFDNFVFPDGTCPTWESVDWLQRRFMKWFNKERLKKVLTFPVETLNLLNDGEDYVDKEYKELQAEMYAEGHSFFTYTSNSVDSLASCCRLKNEFQDNTFSYTLGAGGVSTGSKGVITINLNRLVQNATKNNIDISDAVSEQVEKVHKYLTAYNEIITDYFNARMLPIFDAGYISLEKQFLTIGINGFVEGAEFLGIDISPNEEYFEYGERILKPIYTLNKQAKTKELMFNTEFVPAENLGVKNAKWDKKDGYFVPRECYNSYFYKVEDETCNILDKFILHGNKLTKYLDGGSALHMNLDEHLSKEQYLHLGKVAIKTGCQYYTYNIPNTICNKCGHISKHRLNTCEKCGSEDLDYATRVIGYLKRVSKFAEARIREAARRFYDKFKA
ncbi:MAG: anaerobic ribonucleoside-triphosphate reductase [Clostridiaceae bacterium]|jgi:ribonucleoside-triphosphate reductase|nr:anaerobic ribonucleoside-triphosphate reductase [Clostridiaceae bacterium]MDF2950472.1 anaerobic ribonucleoside-triphosphate reductase [Anaerocolumna sp.]